MESDIKTAWRKAERAVLGHALGCMSTMQTLAEEHARIFSESSEGDS
jgi:hypothetical protein